MTTSARPWTRRPPAAGVALRFGVLLVLAIGLAALDLPWRPRTVCLLRTVCGVPCPLCGGTTAAVEVGRGDLLAALRASPLAVLGSLAFVLAPLVRGATLGARQTWVLVLGVAVAAECYQLHRFDLL